MNSTPLHNTAGAAGQIDSAPTLGVAPQLSSLSPPAAAMDVMDVDQGGGAGDQEYEYYDDEHGDPEWEEEEAYYIFDFGKNLSLPELRAAGNECKILGLETDNPFVQIGPAVFRGSSMESLGQDIIFAKYPSLHALDEESASKFDSNHPGRYPHLQMLHIMDRRVKMTPVRLRHKDSGPANAQSTQKPGHQPPTGQ
ncbi:hypothetical protein BCR44DRAFT_37860 [Catenaria anguillulae PL171]|uniref:Transcription factor TFIIIC triple barrel domain-containing protein n=1 Tax=Catenaria anguillulae PL171 TaxID=765915 RepID=A0A1Y2HXE0_9FUNG|nr:hypothetical protein BCR44DRAFT_37860 [Catenaria anguillulae PL171]